jgi:hypothetical protein
MKIYIAYKRISIFKCLWWHLISDYQILLNFRAQVFTIGSIYQFSKPDIAQSNWGFRSDIYEGTIVHAVYLGGWLFKIVPVITDNWKLQQTAIAEAMNDNLKNTKHENN